MTNEKMHKHKGVSRTDGRLRLHPISRMHKDAYTKKCHQLEINSSLRTIIKKGEEDKSVVTKVKELFKPKLESVIVDSDNYIFVDLTESNTYKGIRIKFNRREGQKERLIGLQIEK